MDDALLNHPDDWERIFQAIGHPTMILDNEYRILQVNRAVTRVLQLSIDEILGKKCHEIFHGSDKPVCDCPLQDMLASRNLETREMMIDALGGIYLVSCTPIPNDDGVIDRIIHIATDVTAKHRAEEELETVLDVLGHDIRNRLQATLLGAGLLIDSCEGVEPDIAAKAIMKSISSLSTMIEKLQSTRGFLNVPLTEVVLEDVLMRAVKVLRFRYPEIHVNLNIEIQNAIVRADIFLENLFMNILENAIIHNTSETKVLWIKATQNAKDYMIRICDNGSGIADHLVEGLFDTKRRFGGIGLLQALRLSKKYGGSLACKNGDEESKGKGAVFTITLPSV